MEHKQKKIALPTKDEQLSLQNSEIILKANLTKLQLNEILTSVRDDETNPKHQKITIWLEQVIDVLKKSDLGDTKSDSTLLLSPKFLVERGLNAFVLHNSSSSANVGALSFAFKPPMLVQLMGSFVLGTATAPFLNCDIAVVMAGSCFDARYVRCLLAKVFLLVTVCF